MYFPVEVPPDPEQHRRRAQLHHHLPNANEHLQPLPVQEGEARGQDVLRRSKLRDHHHISRTRKKGHMVSLVKADAFYWFESKSTPLHFWFRDKEYPR